MLPVNPLNLVHAEILTFGYGRSRKNKVENGSVIGPSHGHKDQTVTDSNNIVRSLFKRIVINNYKSYI